MISFLLKKRLVCLALALFVPPTFIILLGSVQAQRFRPPTQPPGYRPPTYQPPNFKPPTYQPPSIPSIPKSPSYQPPFNPGMPKPPSYTPPGNPGFPNNPGYNPPTNPGMPKPPSYQPPNIQTPIFENVYYCTRCNGELGRGSVRPTINTCPHCGARLINGGGGFNSPPISNPGFNQPAFNNPPNTVNPPPQVNNPVSNPNTVQPVSYSSNTSRTSEQGVGIALVIGGILGALVLAGVVIGVAIKLASG